MLLHNAILLLSYLEVVLGLIVLALLIRGKEFQTYWPMLFVSMWQAIPFFTFLYLRYLGKARISPSRAYHIYFPTYWTAFALGAICAIALTYTVLHGALRPLKGLQQLGNIVYVWAAAISIVIAVDSAFGPNSGLGSTLQLMVTRFQRVSSIITVSLILFVCLAIRPMGLSLKSRIFGTGIGLAAISTVAGIGANFELSARSMYSPFTLALVLVNCLAEAVWVYYFITPEPERKFVLLRTTSPFHRWNLIAEQFGQEPGYVAIGGVPPEAFAKAEIEIFQRASAKMKDSEAALQPVPEPRPL